MKITFATLAILSLSLASCSPKKEKAPAPAPAANGAATNPEGLSVPTVEVGGTPSNEAPAAAAGSGLSVPSVEIGGAPVAAPK